MLISLAARNLLRNPRRTVLTGLAIALGLAMMVFTIALQAGSYDEMIESAVSTTSGHVVVQRRAYVEEPAADVVVPGSDAVAAALRGAIPDAVVAQRLTVDGLLTSSENAVAALVRGVEPSAEARVDLLSRRLVEGEWLQDGDARGVILGRELADSLGVELGDRVVYQGQHGGETTSVLLRVRGVFRVGAADIDGFIAVVDLAAAREMLGQPDVANQVTAHLPDDSRTAAAAAAARAALPALPEEVAVMDWVEAQPGLLDLIAIDKAGGDVMMAFLGLIVAMGVLNTVLMSVLERTREFGVLLSIGARPRHIAAMVLLEAGLLGLFATAIGVALGAALAWPTVVYGLDYGALMGETMTMGDVVLDAKIHSRYDLGRIAVYALASLLFTALSAVYPAWTITRLQPVEALRHV